MLKTKVKSLSNILSTFNKTLSDLDKLIVFNSSKVDNNFKVIETIQLENDDLIEESTKAKKIKENLSNLLELPK